MGGWLAGWLGVWARGESARAVTRKSVQWRPQSEGIAVMYSDVEVARRI
jgi:hypothetical protein